MGPALSADAILRKFADPAQKDSVTAEDVQWALQVKEAERALTRGGVGGGSDVIVAKLLEQQTSLHVQ